MKRNLLALLLSGILLLSNGCSPAPARVPGTQNETIAPQPATTGPVVETEAITEAMTEPAEPATEPPTEPATQSTMTPTEPATEPPTESATEPAFTGFVEQDGKRYYYCQGSMHTGWLSLEDDRYYFLEDGTMAIGKLSVPGSGIRYFTTSGKECILVNPWNHVPEDYSVKLSKYGDYKVAQVCLSSLKEMLSDCKSAGHKALVVSAYRTNSYQANLYKKRVQRFLNQGYSRELAEIEAAKRVAVPGTSEHELGLAMDITDASYTNLDKKQENTDTQKWLMANSWKYGFILRYPNEKTDVTGIIYEPWHYRYVGPELAAELHDLGLCLEEYFESITP